MVVQVDEPGRGATLLDPDPVEAVHLGRRDRASALRPLTSTNAQPAAARLGLALFDPVIRRAIGDEIKRNERRPRACSLSRLSGTTAGPGS